MPDQGFYSIDYGYWRGGKDRVRNSFNPHFFIKIDLAEYISRLEDGVTAKKFGDPQFDAFVKSQAAI